MGDMAAEYVEVDWMKSSGLKKTPDRTEEKQANNAAGYTPKERKRAGWWWRSLRKRTRVMIALGFLLVLAASLVVALYLRSLGNRGAQRNSFGNMGNKPGGGNQFIATENMIVVRGVTNVGVTEECFEVENLTAALEIEEVYVTSEDVIEEGTRILKLSEKSIASAREELEQTLKDAELAYRSGSIEYEQSKITAEYDRDSALLNGQQAKAVYEETISSLKSSVERAQEELDQARADIAEYQSYVNNDTYRSYFKVDEYQAVYDETLAALQDKMQEWGVPWSQVTGQGGGSSMGSSNSGNMSSGSISSEGGVASDMTLPENPASRGAGEENAGATSDQIQALSSLYKVLEKQRKELDQAQSDFEDALANAALKLQTLELELPELENALAEAEKNYQRQILQAELTYETALTNAQSANNDYETAMQKAETKFQSLQKDWEDAGKNLELFESRVGDGYFYASGSGTILRTMVRAGQNLTSEATVFMYSNPKEMMVTVSVDQTSISDVALNDSVYIQAGEYGGFEGIVTKINPMSSSGSRTSVTYSVTISFVEESMDIPANESVTVIFGMDGVTIQDMLLSSPEASRGGVAEEEHLPEGYELPENGQHPEGRQGHQVQGSQSGETESR